MKFDENYTNYWESSVKKSVDGTIIAGPQEANHFFSRLDIIKSHNIIDLGCSTGRMFKLLNQYSENIYGVDPDEYAVKKSSNLGYKEVRQGTAEKMSYRSEFFDIIFCWAAFDVVDHFSGFKEINRVLKKDGKLLFTCKGNFYDSSDQLAFKAEKNAYLKNFPNRFTDILSLCIQIEKFGFEIIDLFTFEKRGDMGKLRYKKIDHEEVIDDNQPLQAYEYLMNITKVSEPKVEKRGEIDDLESSFSVTAESIAKEGFPSANSYFEAIGID